MRGTTLSGSAGVPLRILYVEDNEIVRELTCEMLMREDRRIVAFGTAEEALAEFVEGGFDLVITDVSLPKMSGIEFVREIRRLRPDTPVIVATGYPLHTLLSEWGNSVTSVNKPFDSEQIDVLIAAFISNAAS